MIPEERVPEVCDPVPRGFSFLLPSISSLTLRITTPCPTDTGVQKILSSPNLGGGKWFFLVLRRHDNWWGQGTVSTTRAMGGVLRTVLTVTGTSKPVIHSFIHSSSGNSPSDPLSRCPSVPRPDTPCHQEGHRCRCSSVDSPTRLPSF